MEPAEAAGVAVDLVAGLEAVDRLVEDRSEVVVAPPAAAVAQAGSQIRQYGLEFPRCRCLAARTLTERSGHGTHPGHYRRRDFGGRTAGGAHPLEKSAPGFRNTSIHRLFL